MKYTKLFLAATFVCTALSSAYAVPSVTTPPPPSAVQVTASTNVPGVPTANDIAKMVSKVKMPNAREALSQWTQACTAQQWGRCQTAWWGLINAGLRSVENDGFSYWEFPGQVDATTVVLATQAYMEQPERRDNWVIMLNNVNGNNTDYPSFIEGRAGLNDPVKYKIALELIQGKMAQKGVQLDYDIDKMDQMEWYRTLAFMFAARDDKNSSAQVLKDMQTLARADASTAPRYNDTLAKVTQYFR